jgi:hypothetical protein
MRKIEQQMKNAIHRHARWALDNTLVDPLDELTVAVYLHGHEIALINQRSGLVMVNENTLKAYPTNTTKSRLRALGVDVATRKGVTYLYGKPV